MQHLTKNPRKISLILIGILVFALSSLYILNTAFQRIQYSKLVTSNSEILNVDKDIDLNEDVLHRISNNINIPQEEIALKKQISENAIIYKHQFYNKLKIWNKNEIDFLRNKLNDYSNNLN